MSNSRMLRVAELIQSELANMVMRDVKDPRVRNVVITRVEVSPDLRVAKVYFSRYGKNQGNFEEIEEGLKGLERASGFLQMKLAERLQLKNTPRLKFFTDLSLAYSDEIERLLSDLKEISLRKDSRLELSGVLNLKKKHGPTSHDMVDEVRKLLPAKTKVGHAGTLDPMAEGVLPICIGNSTKLFSYFFGVQENVSCCHVVWTSDRYPGYYWKIVGRI